MVVHRVVRAHGLIYVLRTTAELGRTFYKLRQGCLRFLPAQLQVQLSKGQQVAGHDRSHHASAVNRACWGASESACSDTGFQAKAELPAGTMQRASWFRFLWLTQGHIQRVAGAFKSTAQQEPRICRGGYFGGVLLLTRLGSCHRLVWRRVCKRHVTVVVAQLLETLSFLLPAGLSKQQHRRQHQQQQQKQQQEHCLHSAPHY